MYEKTGDKGALTGAYGGLPSHLVSIFAANVLLALEHVHNQGFAFRSV